jgi:hypothetical protein
MRHARLNSNRTSERHLGREADIIVASPGERPARLGPVLDKWHVMPHSMRLDLMPAVSRAGLVGRLRAKPRLNTGQPKGWPV